MTTDVRLYEILDLVSNLNIAQLSIEDVADSDLGFKMAGYKDADGATNKWLCKDKPVKASTMQITALSSLGLVLNAADGTLSTSTALPSVTTAVTQSPGDNTTKVATTAFVTAAVVASVGPWSRTGTSIYPTVLTDSIGIGTSSPIYPLQIGDTSGSIALGGSPTTNGGGSIYMINSNARKNWLISNNNSVAGAFEISRSTVGGGSTFTTPDLIITTTGNVGIGDTLPLNKLDVNGVIVSKGANLSHEASCVKMSYEGSSCSQIVAYGADASTAGIFEIITKSSDNSINNANALIILGNGNIGSGTGTPDKQFTIYNDSNAWHSIQSLSGNAYIEFVTGADKSLIVRNSANVLKINNVNSSSQTHIGITATGNVGINEAAPAQKLEVNGSALIQGSVLLTDAGTEYMRSTVAGYTSYGAASGHIFDNNIGLNVTPGSWHSTFESIAFGGTYCSIAGKSTELTLNRNSIYSSGNNRWDYVLADYTTQIQQTNEIISLNTAASGSVGNAVSFRSKVRVSETEVWINYSARDVDFNVASDTITYALTVQGSDGYVGLGKVPTYPLSIALSTNDWSIEDCVNSVTQGDVIGQLKVRKGTTVAYMNLHEEPA